MKRLTEVWDSIGAPRHQRLELSASATQALGFRPAFLDVATMQIYLSRLAGSPPAADDRFIDGFERRGFFYTRQAASRACKEWGFGA